MLSKGAGAVWILPPAEGAGVFAIGIITLPWLFATFACRRRNPAPESNVFGGTILFSALSYAQVREEIFEEEYSKR